MYKTPEILKDFQYFIIVSCFGSFIYLFIAYLFYNYSYEEVPHVCTCKTYMRMHVSLIHQQDVEFNFLREILFHSDLNQLSFCETYCA